MDACAILGEASAQGLCSYNSVLHTLLSDTPYHLWTLRIAIVVTLAHIKRGYSDHTLALTTRYQTHPHDLIHKALD